MARKAREKSKSGVYAVILKSEYDIFEDDEINELFSKTANEYLSDGLLGMKLLPRRAELLVRESEAGISYDMKPLIISFARAYNKLRNIEGKVFSDRFKSVPVETKELERQCIAYLEGGEPAMPYRSRRAMVKPVKKAEDATAPQQQKTKKKKDLPTWLL